MKLTKIYTLPSFVIAKHSFVLLATFYYSIVLAAVVFDTSEWSDAILKSLPIFFFMAAGWLFFHRFKVLSLSFRYLSLLSFLIFSVLYFPYTNVGSYFHMEPGYYRSHMGLGQWINNIGKTLNVHVLIWAPYIFFTVFFIRGFKRSCPKCNIVNGLYARVILAREFLHSSEYTAMETTETRSTVFTGGSKNIERIVRETRPVKYNKHHFRADCECKMCKHKWSYEYTTTTKA